MTHHSLFHDDAGRHQPLAELLRPQSLSDVIGHEHLTKDGGILQQMIEKETLHSIIFWGPPGTGKTTLAHIVGKQSNIIYKSISAIFSGVAELKKLFEEAKEHQNLGKKMCLFVDEIHRFNKAQQDCFLPVLEDGTIILIGATTENPSFALNNALLSRVQIITLEALNDDDLFKLLTHVEEKIEKKLPLDNQGKNTIISFCEGDGRYLLNIIEAILQQPSDHVLSISQIEKIAQKKLPLYDKASDEHYNITSALHKSIRGSDENASLYWLHRMLQAGEDPRYIARRLLRIAYEDIGLSDLEAAPICIHAWETYERLGSPEGEIALSQAVIYLALSPKSNAVYVASKMAAKDAKNFNSLSPPKHILNAPNDFMKEQGYGKNYAYDHDQEDSFSGQHYFPDNMMREYYYEPRERGFERDIQKRQEYYHKLRMKRQKNHDDK